MRRLDGDLRNNPVRVNHPVQKREDEKQTVKPDGGNVNSNNAAMLKEMQNIKEQVVNK